MYILIVISNTIHIPSNWKEWLYSFVCAGFSVCGLSSSMNLFLVTKPLTKSYLLRAALSGRTRLACLFELPHSSKVFQCIKPLACPLLCIYLLFYCVIDIVHSLYSFISVTGNCFPGLQARISSQASQFASLITYSLIINIPEFQLSWCAVSRTWLIHVHTQTIPESNLFNKLSSYIEIKKHENTFPLNTHVLAKSLLSMQSES